MALSLLTSPVFAEEAKNGKMSEIQRTIAVQRATQVAIWIPTGEDFFLMFRLYGPEEIAFDKTWQLGEIEKVK
jgi:hypothetical protein